MTIETIYTRGKSKFSARIETWCSQKGIENQLIEKDEKLIEEIDGLVIFHEDHNLDSIGVELREVFERKLKPIHKIDVNGTKQVSLSHYGLWLERNACKNVLMIGTESLVDNESFETLMSKL
jgi:hypothetical protein